MVLKHFSARDMVCRWDVLEVHKRATSLAAAHFLDTLVNRMPFPIAALQVNGGSEFAAEFETACQQRGLPLFVLPPRSPKLNGQVECQLSQSTTPPLGTHLEHRASSQALGYQTPLEFLERWKSQPLKAECH